MIQLFSKIYIYMNTNLILVIVLVIIILLGHVSQIKNLEHFGWRYWNRYPYRRRGWRSSFLRGLFPWRWYPYYYYYYPRYVYN